MNKCFFCHSYTEYEVCGECIKCPLCGGPSINGKYEADELIFLRKSTASLSGECPKCKKKFMHLWETKGFSGEVVELGAFIVQEGRAEKVEDILKRQEEEDLPLTRVQARFRALIID